MLIETERLLIRELKAEDKVSLIEMASDGSLGDVGFDIGCSDWLADWLIEAKRLTDMDDPKQDYLAYGIELKEKNIVIGMVGCSYYSEFNEVGATYFIGGKYRRNGYAVEAVKAYVHYFIKRYNTDKLIATIKQTNIPSLKTIEKAGFELVKKEMYKDSNDKKAEMYCFYEKK